MYRALIVCNSRFPNDPTSLGELHGPKVDGILLRDALTDHATGLFDRADVRMLHDADSREVLIEIEDFFGVAAPDDTLLFYYSGHGRSTSQQLFLCARDTVARKLYSTAIPEATINGVISSSYAQSKILILDCCYSGMFKGDEVVASLAGTGRYVIAATSSTHRANDSSGPGMPSPFTRVLADGLLADANDRDDDGQVDLDDLFSYLSNVEFEGARPQRRYDGAGSVPVARRSPLTDAPRTEIEGTDTTSVQTEAAGSMQKGQKTSFLDTLTFVTSYSAERVRDFRQDLRNDVADAMPEPLTAVEFLQRASLLRDGSLTYAGALLFGENPTAVLPTALVQCVQIHGTSKDDPLETTELRGTVPELVVQARDFVADLARRGEAPTTEGPYAEPVFVYPMIAVREIVANAVVHRDYEATEACVQIHVYTDRIEVINPGSWGSLPAVTEGRSRLGRLERQSRRRNFRLAQVLTWSKLVEGVGSGVPRAVADCKRLGAPEPIVTTADDLVTVTIYPKPPNTPATASTADAATKFALTPDRIAEIVVRGDDGTARRGSGYRVTQTGVLTVAHILDNASDIQIRFEADLAGEWVVSAVVAWADREMDVAVLQFDSPSGVPAVGPARYAQLAERDAIVDVMMAGFPRWKMRSSPDGRFYRDLAQVPGTAALLSNRRSRTMELVVNPPGEDVDSVISPWEGMSGAAVWAGERIVGVVTSHHQREGGGRLTAARIDRSLESAGSQQLALLLGVPVDIGLVDVVPAGPASSARSGYLAQVRDIAPAGGLVGREAELRELASFCAGDDPYGWWQGGPWTGKSALMSTFVLNPPAGVDIVSFFTSARLAGQADSAAFTDALVEQLSATVGESLPTDLSPQARDVHRRMLLTAAVRRAQQTGRRLVLVIDGLDEDRGTSPGSGLASIASLLPKVPEEGLRIIVAGRPNPPIPSDVPEDHPLRTSRIRHLTGSPHGHQVLALARRELDELLAGDDRIRDLVGLIAASGSGLAVSDLEDLTARPPYELQSLLGGNLGRTLASTEDPSVTGRSMFMFAHETLYLEACQRLGKALLTQYRDRIHTWADSYQHRQWPDRTPSYLLTAYPKMLAATGDLSRLVNLVTDTSRQDRMRATTGGDIAGITEIKSVLDLLLLQDQLDLGLAIRLAIHRDRLIDRNADIPSALPAVWAALGRAQRAEALAQSMPDSDRRAQALAAVAVALSGKLNDPVKASASSNVTDDSEIQAIADPGRRAEALTALAQRVARDGDHERAEALASSAEKLAMSIGTSAHRSLALSLVAQGLARVGNIDHAEALARSTEGEARSIGDPTSRSKALVALAEVAARVGDLDHSEALARLIADPVEQVRAMASLVTAASTIDLDRAVALSASVEALARSIADPAQQGRALAALVEAVGVAGDLDRAETLARSIVDPVEQGRALAALVEAVGVAGDLDRAETLARSIADPAQLTRALAALVGAVGAAGDLDHAEELAESGEALARSVADPAQQAYALTALAGAVNPQHSLALVVRALSLSRWIDHVDVLLRIAGDALEVIGEETNLEEFSAR